MTSPETGRHDDIWQAVRKAAEKHPDRIALSDGAEEISYGRLVTEAARRAAALRARGLAPSEPVALCAGRSVAQVLAVLGVLAAGGAVAPFPAHQAAGATREAIARLAPRLVLGDKDARALLPEALPLDTGADPGAGSGAGPAARPAEADGLAYVLHTSGSSGRPKAVHVPHSAVRNRFAWGQSLYPVGPGDTVLYAGSLVFDCQMWVVLAPLCHGATLLVAPEGAEAEPHRVAELARRHGVTVMHFVPSLLREFLAAGAGDGLAGLRYLLVAGERLPGELAGRVRAATTARVINQYGPTEACIDVLNHELTARDAEADAVPIGRPITGVRAVVRDPDDGSPVPPGGTGELLLGGVCLAWGYGEAAGTAARFVPDDDPAHPGERLYRTGDLVRDRGDGVHEFLGRVDHQVKIRGVRVEPSETEHALLRHPGVAQAAVVAVPDESGDARLVAHLVPAGPAVPDGSGSPDGHGATGGSERAHGSVPSSSELRTFLLDRLPPAALPAVYHAHTALPRLSSGKIDRLALARLPEHEASAPPRPAHLPPRTPTEEAVAGLWRELLATGELGRASDWFELGGQSLVTMRMLARIRRRFGVRLSARTVFAAPTVERFAAAVDEAAGTTAPASAAVRTGGEAGNPAETADIADPADPANTVGAVRPGGPGGSRSPGGSGGPGGSPSPGGSAGSEGAEVPGGSPRPAERGAPDGQFVAARPDGAGGSVGPARAPGGSRARR
ncbi:non-ribosomal peptide synthetase [Streptomyces sp. NRRL F-5053]|uniref:non-ribosomal peptide synthetase n=1 Tax=Streptomyces sp. NRRL F-5053 TaxID=1463854 RepID=UPI001331A9BE|nr:amino acid adenylation domain-containing protein [Streptomyces sp. NRRL F-5053]